MDLTDYSIIKILQSNGRISMKELGMMVSLTPPAVAERVKRLEEKGIISGYKAVINHKKLGKNICVLINLDMKVGNRKKFLEFFNKTDEIIESFHVTGPYCMIVKAHLNDISCLERLVGKLQVFGDTETFIILSNYTKDKFL